MMIIQPGEFWVADIPFTDGSGSKKRPVLSRLDCLEQTLLIARIGVIAQNDASDIQQTWARHIKPQF